MKNPITWWMDPPADNKEQRNKGKTQLNFTLLMKCYKPQLESSKSCIRVKGAIYSQLNWAILLCEVVPDVKTE